MPTSTSTDLASLSLVDLARDARALPLRRAARAALGVAHATPVEFVEGDAAPTITGRSWRYETKGGTVIAHPSAYRRRSWSAMVYRPSTRRVVVGRDWTPTPAAV